jgi:hypothetical protein
MFAGSLEINPHAATARRLVVVLSPESLNTGWTELSVGHVLKQLSNIPIRTIVVALKELPSSLSLFKRSSQYHRENDASCPANFADHSGVEVLRCQEANERELWYRLRLSLPAMRPMNTDPGCQSVDMIVQTNNGKTTHQQKARSCESLEVLV